MSKQEKIGEGIAHLIADACYRYFDERIKANSETDYYMNFNALLEAKDFLNYLHENDVVIKVGEISDDLAQTASQGETRSAYGVGLSWERNVDLFRAFKEAGYVAVEKLIKEG